MRPKTNTTRGHITLNDVNIGIALPDGIKKLTVGCNWGQKTVDVLAARSMFDGFVGKNTEALTQLVADNRLIAEYSKACRDELKYGCVVRHAVRRRCHRLPHPVPQPRHSGGFVERRKRAHRLRACHH